MSIKEAMAGTPQHKLEARSMAEQVFNNKPEIQLEMQEEFNLHLKKLNQKHIEKLRT